MPKCCVRCYMFDECANKNECCPECDYYSNGKCIHATEVEFHEELEDE